LLLRFSKRARIIFTIVVSLTTAVRIKENSRKVQDEGDIADATPSGCHMFVSQRGR